jgi:streptomycin 6-kinase
LTNLKIKDYLTNWQLTLDEPPFVTSTGLVAKVNGAGHSYILKIAAEGSDEKTALILAHYDGYGAVKVIKSDRHAILLERAIPGTSLRELALRGEDEKATHILCDVIQKLHTNEEAIESLPSIEDLGESFDIYLLSHEKQIPIDLVCEAKLIYNELVKSQETPLVLHGDLHHHNVVYDHIRGWLAIDPKGYKGESVYEVGALLRNPPHFHPTLPQIKRRISILCDRLGFDPERVRAWGFSQAVLAAIWSVEDRHSPKWAIDVAHMFKEVFK